MFILFLLSRVVIIARQEAKFAAADDAPRIQYKNANVQSRRRSALGLKKSCFVVADAAATNCARVLRCSLIRAIKMLVISR